MTSKAALATILLIASMPSPPAAAQDGGPPVMMGKGCSIYANGVRDRDASHWVAKDVVRQESSQTTYASNKNTLGPWNDRISAIQCYGDVGARCYMKAYADESLAGRQLYVPDLDGFVVLTGTEWDNTISSFRIVCVRLN